MQLFKNAWLCHIFFVVGGISHFDFSVLLGLIILVATH